jgi:hypothetical protein
LSIDSLQIKNLQHLKHFTCSKNLQHSKRDKLNSHRNKEI